MVSANNWNTAGLLHVKYDTTEKIIMAPFLQW